MGFTQVQPKKRQLSTLVDDVRVEVPSEGQRNQSRLLPGAPKLKLTNERCCDGAELGSLAQARAGSSRLSTSGEYTKRHQHELHTKSKGRIGLPKLKARRRSLC
jgi:hypothetical protein